MPVQDPDPRAPIQKLPAVEKPTEDPLGHHPAGDQKAIGRMDRTKVAELFADERCSRFSRDNGRRKDGRPTAEEAVASGSRGASRSLGRKNCLGRNSQTLVSLFFSFLYLIVISFSLFLFNFSFSVTFGG